MNVCLCRTPKYISRCKLLKVKLGPFVDAV